MAYVNEQFPEDVAKGSRGGPRMSMSVVELDSGAQERAKRWPVYRWEYDVGVGIQYLSQLDDAYAHYLSVGVENSFPFKDLQDFTSHADNRSTPTPSGTLDQVIGVGDSTDGTNGTNRFQLIKSYTFGTRTYTRNIRKPISTGLAISVAGTLKTITTHYTVNTSTGEITFTAGNVPTTGQTIRASFEFRVPVFYGAEFAYKTALDAFNAGRIPEISFVEDVSQAAITPEFLYQGAGSTIALAATRTPYDYNWGTSVFFSVTAAGSTVDVILPDLADLPYGGPYFWFYDLTAGKTINFRHKATDVLQFALTANTGAAVIVRDDNGTKKWVAM